MGDKLLTVIIVFGSEVVGRKEKKKRKLAGRLNHMLGINREGLWGANKKKTSNRGRSRGKTWQTNRHWANTKPS